MKKVMIFLGSSITEFEKEREDLANFIYHVSDDFFEETYRVRVRPIRCNDADPRMAVGGKQNEYNEALKTCDFCFFFFGKKAGEYTLEELDIAHEAFLETKKRPAIYVYFQNSDGPEDPSIVEAKRVIDEKYRHYWGVFDSMDTIKLRIMLCLKTAEASFAEVAVQNDELFLDKKKVEGLSLVQVPEFSKNRDLNALRAKFAEVDGRYLEVKMALRENESDELEEQYRKLMKERSDLQAQITRLSKEIFDLSQRLTDDIAKGELSPRLKKAYQCLERGDKEGCLSFLDPKEIADEYASDLLSIEAEQALLAAKHREASRRYIKEISLRIDTLMLDYSRKDRVQEILSLYDMILPVVRKEGIETQTLVSYAVFLMGQQRALEALEVMNEALKVAEARGDYNEIYSFYFIAATVVYRVSPDPKLIASAFDRLRDLLPHIVSADNPDQEHMMSATLFLMQAEISRASTKWEDCIQYCELGEDELDKLDADTQGYGILALNLHANVAFAYIAANETEKAKEEASAAIYFGKAEEARNPEAALPLATAYAALGSVEARLGNVEVAEENIATALKYLEPTLSKDWMKGLMMKASFHFTTAMMFAATHNYKMASKYGDVAFETLRQMEALDPVSTAILMPQYEMAIGMQLLAYDFEKAENMLLDALKRVEPWTKTNPYMAHDTIVGICSTLGFAFMQAQDFDKAKDYFRRAYHSCKILAEQSEVHEEALANIVYCLSSVLDEDDEEYEEVNEELVALAAKFPESAAAESLDDEEEEDDEPNDAATALSNRDATYGDESADEYFEFIVETYQPFFGKFDHYLRVVRQQDFGDDVDKDLLEQAFDRASALSTEEAIALKIESINMGLSPAEIIAEVGVEANLCLDDGTSYVVVYKDEENAQAILQVEQGEDQAAFAYDVLTGEVVRMTDPDAIAKLFAEADDGD